MTNAQAEALAATLKGDLQQDNSMSYHNHVMLALVNGLSDAEIRTAIEKGKDVIIEKITTERAGNDIPGAEREEIRAQVIADLPEWESNIIDNEKLFASMQGLNADDDEDGTDWYSLAELLGLGDDDEEDQDD